MSTVPSIPTRRQTSAPSRQRIRVTFLKGKKLRSQFNDPSFADRCSENINYWNSRPPQSGLSHSSFSDLEERGRRLALEVFGTLKGTMHTADRDAKLPRD